MKQDINTNGVFMKEFYLVNRRKNYEKKLVHIVAFNFFFYL